MGSKFLLAAQVAVAVAGLTAAATGFIAVANAPGHARPDEHPDAFSPSMYW